MGKKLLKLFKELPRKYPYNQWIKILNMPIEITQGQYIEMNDLCKQIEEDNSLLKIVFRIFVDVVRTCPEHLNDVESVLKEYYPKIKKLPDIDWDFLFQNC